MKRLSFIFLMIFSNIVFSQQANEFFPNQLGYVWNYKVTPLDSINNPIVQLEYFRKDSFGVVSNYKGRMANIVFSKEGGWQTINSQPYLDTNFYSFEGTIGFEYFSSSGIEPFLLQLDSLQLDPNFNFVTFFKSLQNWYSVYRFAANVNSIYTLMQKDTTISNFNIRFRYAAIRNHDQTVSTLIGTFNCKKFTTVWDFSLLVGSFVFPLFSIDDTVWIAPGNWMVQAYQPSKSVDLSLLGIPPFKITGRRIHIIDQITNIDDESFIVHDFVLFQNYPNPFGNTLNSNNPTTKISWQSSIGSRQILKVYDILGNEVATLVDEYRDAGKYEFEFDAERLPSGVYFYKLQNGEQIQVKKMILIR